MTEFVSAIICTRNRPDLIAQAVTSVLDNTYPAFELVVIDQSDGDRTAQVVRALAAEHSNIRYIHSETPGLSRAYNTAIRESTGDLLAFTDDDCVPVETGWRRSWRHSRLIRKRTCCTDRSAAPDSCGSDGECPASSRARSASANVMDFACMEWAPTLPRADTCSNALGASTRCSGAAGWLNRHRILISSTACIGWA